MNLFFTTHARERMSLRVIDNQEVREALQKGIWRKKGEEYISEFNMTKVVFVLDQEQGIAVVVTVMHTKWFQKKVNHLTKKLKVSCRVATKQLKKIA